MVVVRVVPVLRTIVSKFLHPHYITRFSQVVYPCRLNNTLSGHDTTFPLLAKRHERVKFQQLISYRHNPEEAGGETGQERRRGEKKKLLQEFPSPKLPLSLSNTSYIK